ncbi:MAG: PRC-barrel domain-containing protein [Burkholderiaceae bacterium]|nr:PRC-barrel domain-containing protein [Burkholderiaceae bacterium]
MFLSLSVAPAGAWATGPDGAHGGAANAAASTAVQPQANADSAMRSAQQPPKDRQQLREVRATDLIGANVRNPQQMSLGEIEDLIVDMKTGEVRYAILAFDPGILSGEKLWGVPTSELRMSDVGNTVIYDLDRERLERATLDRSSFDDDLVFDGKRVMNNLDAAYGLYQPSSGARAHRASDLVGENLVNRAGDGIGRLADLVIDMNRQRVHYAVLELDAGIASPERDVVVPLHALEQNLDDSALLLKIDDSKLD